MQICNKKFFIVGGVGGGWVQVRVRLYMFDFIRNFQTLQLRLILQTL